MAMSSAQRQTKHRRISSVGKDEAREALKALRLIRRLRAEGGSETDIQSALETALDASQRHDELKMQAVLDAD